MEDDKFKDLLEDEELTALRLAALASKKKSEQQSNDSESANALPINSIITASNATSEQVRNQIPFVQSDRSGHSSYSWRKQNQSSRRRGGPFPKNNQRSNLIVISPVVALNEGKDSDEKVPALILPQHKWCNSGNEDSMSPKTLRRTGPTRFNRHGSDSESSDESDYDPSDNDSGSNETILQDEPPEHFSHLSPGRDNLSDSVEKNRRLSFPSLDSEMKSDNFDKNEATSVYKSLKSSLYSDTKQDRYALEQQLNDGGQTFNSSITCNTGLSYTTKPTDLSEDLKKQGVSDMETEKYSDKTNLSLSQLSNSVKMWQSLDNNSSACYSKDGENSQNFRLNERNHTDNRQPFSNDIYGSNKPVWQQGEGLRTDTSLYSMENQRISTDSKIYTDSGAKTQYLSENDLRFELKKRMMQEVKSKQSCIESNKMAENRVYSQYDNSWTRNRQKSYKDDVELPSTNSYDETKGSSFHQTNRINQNYSRENDDVEHASNLNRQRSNRSLSQERTIHRNFSDRDKSRFEYSSDSRRNNRYNRSSSLDRNRSARSSSRGRRRERSSSRDEKRLDRSSSRDRKKRDRSSSRDSKRRDRSSSRDSKRRGRSSSRDSKRRGRSSSRDSKRRDRSSSRDSKRRERSSSQGKVKYDSSGRSECNLSSKENKLEHLYRHGKGKNDKNVTEEKRNWYKSSPLENSEDSFSQNLNKYDHISSLESKHGYDSQDRNKVLFGNSGNKQESNVESNTHAQSYEKNHKNDLSKTKHSLNSSSDRDRRALSSSRGRGKRRSSHSSDSKSDHSSSPKKRRYNNSSREGSKERHSSSSEGESRFRLKSKNNLGASKFTSNLHKSKHDVAESKNKIMKTDESRRNTDQDSSAKNKCAQYSKKSKEEGPRKISTRDLSNSLQQNILDRTRSKSKEKVGENKKLHQKFNKTRNSYKRSSRSHSSTSDSCSSSYSSSSSQKYRPKIRSVPSVVKSVLVKSETENRGNSGENKLVGKSTSSVMPQSSVHSVCLKRNFDNTQSNKPSNIKSGRLESDLKASENKRVPVHMRLGAFPRKRVIQMPKDVEAVFVNSSSSSDDENVNTKCKRQNIRIVTDMYDAKNRIDLIQQKYSLEDKSAKRSSPDTYKEKFKRVKAQR